MSQLSISEVLDLAADMIQTRGWHGFADEIDGTDPWGSDGQSKVCVEGAIFAVVGAPVRGGYNALIGFDPETLSAICPAYAAVHEYLELTPFQRLWMWNDLHTRTEAEVIETLRAAAAVQRVKEESLNTKEVCA